MLLSIEQEQSIGLVTQQLTKRGQINKQERNMTCEIIVWLQNAVLEDITNAVNQGSSKLPPKLKLTLVSSK
jgi:hypothetical protein